jgi:O-antigen/teichoic acid export membrane protein
MVFRTNLQWMVGTAFVVACGIWFTSPLILRLFGKDFGDSRLYLVLLLSSAVIETLTIAIYQLVQTSGRMWLSLFAIGLPRDMLLIGLSLYLVPKYAGIGLAWAYVAAQVITLVTVTTTAIVVRSDVLPDSSGAGAS